MPDEEAPLLDVPNNSYTEPKPESEPVAHNELDVPDLIEPSPAPGPSNKNESDNGNADSKGKKSSDDSTNSQLGQKAGINLSFPNAARLETQVHKDMIMHILAFEYFQCQQFYYFTVPQAIFTALSSVLAFAASSSILKDYGSQISLLVGSLSAMVVLFQTIGNVRQYGIRSDRHNTAALQLRDLRDDMIMTKLKLGELQKMNDDDSSVDDPDPITFADVQKRYRQCLSSCSSTIPIRIQEAFHGLETNIELQQSKTNIDIIKEMYPDPCHQTMLKSKAYDIMAGEIVNSAMFPHGLPNSKRVVEKVMRKLKQRVKASKDFYKDVDEVDLESL